MRVIYKYQIDLAPRTDIEMPYGAKILTVGRQDGKLMLWAEIDANNLMAKRIIWLIGTGWSAACSEHCPYIGTIFDGDFVWHIYDGGWG